jgi:hypothetical protein
MVLAPVLTQAEREELLSLDLHHQSVRDLLTGYLAAGLDANADTMDREDRARAVIRHILDLFVEGTPKLLEQAELVYLMTKGNLGQGRR